MLRRLLQVVPTVIGIVLVGFLLIHLAPGDPVLALAGEHGDAEYYEFMRQRFGLDEPLPEQLITYFGRVAAGDLGVSYVHGRGTAQVIVERVPATMLLTGTALFLAVIVSIPLGAIAARNAHGTKDIGINASVLVFFSAPVFWMGQLAILALALKLGVLPVQGMASAGSAATGWPYIVDVLRHLALPALVLASQELAVLVRLTRSGLIDELARDHIRTARAKGISESVVLVRHAMPRALMPVVTVIGARAGQLIAGAVVVEIVFGWPGIGRLLLTSLQTRDTPLLLALFIAISFAVTLANLVTDLVHSSVDPRVRLG
ncbi:MAG: ABC transporter permease [Gemmatimonadaceae bacterium]|nr:ABC transporter permease [Gemmatimonadaceae bacterium]MDQ3520145.1 ABC transporter permease [Gemmatimonadota bacterium]